MEKIWRIKQKYNPQILQKLGGQLGFQHPIFVPILANRGIRNQSELKAFLDSSEDDLHEPLQMQDMGHAVSRIVHAINKGEKVVIYGDYDVDGTTSVALVYRFLKPHLPHIEFYVPDRHKEGYGISAQSIQHVISEKVDLVIALDCGIRSVDLIQRAKDAGVDFIVCDHHLPGDTLPPAVAVLDPKRSDCPYPFKELSGCGIGFKLCQAIENQIGSSNVEVMDLIDLAAISIVSDLVELTGENRILVKLGLQKLRTNPLLGLKIIMEKAIDREWLDVEEILFMIGPRINAAGRLASANAAVDLLLAESEEEAQDFTQILNGLNSERRVKDQNTTKQALAQIETDPHFAKAKSTVVFQADWHKGVIGIVASRLQETHFRPTIVLTESEGKITGSARSIENFNIHEALKACSEYLIQFGGHKYAAGMTLARENVADFKAAFDKIAQRELSDDDLVPKLDYDCELDWRKIDLAFLDRIKKFGPFGPGNMQPMFVSRSVKDSGYARTLGAGGDHLKINLWDSEKSMAIEGIGFNLGHHYPAISEGNAFDLLYTIEENHFRGNTTIQLNIKDVRPL